MNDVVNAIMRDYRMEPDPKYGELMNEEQTVGLVQDDHELPFVLEGTPADEVAFRSRDDGSDLYGVEVGADYYCFKAELMEPVLQRRDMSVKEAFLFTKEPVIARAPLPDGWNVIVAQYLD